MFLVVATLSSAESDPAVFATAAPTIMPFGKAAVINIFVLTTDHMTTLCERASLKLIILKDLLPNSAVFLISSKHFVIGQFIILFLWLKTSLFTGSGSPLSLALFPDTAGGCLK